MPQASALYSKGAMAAAWPWRKASAIVTWPRKPKTASPASTQPWPGRIGTHCGAASRLPPTAIAAVVQKTSAALDSVRLMSRPSMFDSA